MTEAFHLVRTHARGEGILLTEAASQVIDGSVDVQVSEPGTHGRLLGRGTRRVR